MQRTQGVFLPYRGSVSALTALVAAVTDMGHALGIEITAEFVENAQTMDLLKNMGVDHAQGYHIGRPALPR